MDDKNKAKENPTRIVLENVDLQINDSSDAPNELGDSSFPSSSSDNVGGGDSSSAVDSAPSSGSSKTSNDASTDAPASSSSNDDSSSLPDETGAESSPSGESLGEKQKNEVPDDKEDEENKNNKNKNENQSPNNKAPKEDDSKKKYNNNAPKEDDSKKKYNKDNKNQKKPGEKKPNKPGGNANGKGVLGDKLKKKVGNFSNNSKVEQAASKAKKAADTAKKAVNTAKAVVSFFSTPAGWITLAVIAGLILIFFLIILIPTMFASGSPGLGGDVNDEENLSKYSEVDQKTLDKLSSTYEDYPDGDPALAMAAVVFPYIEELHDGNVNSLKGNTNEEQEDEEEEEDTSSDSTDDDTEDLEDDEEDLNEDDPYLELFRKWKYRKKFKELLRESEDGQDALISYLKETYFSSDKGYKEMFDGCSDEDELADAIVNNLLAIREDFEGYFFEICITSASYESVGQVTVDDEVYSSMMQGNVVIELLEAGCGSTTSCGTYATLTLEEYVKGVVYEEINGSITSDNIEVVKAQMVAAKSYTLSRRTPEQTSEGVYVIKMRWSTADQDYCDYLNGCEDVQENYGYNNSGDCLNDDGTDKCKHHSNHAAASDEVKSVLDQAWEETQDYYVLDSNGVPRGSYMASCSIGSCMSQQDMGDIDGDFIAILGYFYTDYVIAEQEGEYTSAYVGVSTELCGDDVSGGISDSDFVFYYQTDYPDVAFCGATDFTQGCSGEGSNTICTSGCGVTAYAMVIATLSDTESSFDPLDANDEATSSGSCAVGSGTNNSLFTNIANNHSDFTVEEIPVTKEGADEVIEALENGGLVVANVQSSSPFTNGGHWIVIRAVTEEGAVKVADPISQERSTSEVYDIYDFIDENWLVDEDGVTHSWFAIYGPKSEEFKYTAAAGVSTGQLSWPIENVTSTCSDYPNYSNGSSHGGTDLSVSVGTDVLAADGGTVITSEDITTGDCSNGRYCNGGYFSYGRYIEIEHDDGTVTMYAHLSERLVEVGDQVAKGQVIGKSGNTGNSSGPHLHVEVIVNGTRQNPCDYMT